MLDFNIFADSTSLDSVFDTFETYLFQKLNVMRIGIIQEVLENNTIRCSICNKKLLKENKDGSRVWGDYPPIYAKVWYMGSGSTGINYPLTIGTPCLMLFNDREIDSYFDTGEISTLQDTRTHSLNDCIAIPLYQSNSGIDFNISTSGDININAKTINLNATTININGQLIINGKPYLEHTHSNGNQGASTGGINNA